MGIVAGNIVIQSVAEYKQETQPTVASTIAMDGRSIRDILAQIQSTEETVEEPIKVVNTLPVINKKTSKYLRDMFNGNDLISFG